ncbi:MAG: hypothetical protein A2Z48_04505 [Actinobacteria bacterium RBG_19FT_COMBO_70_19]|nr:MAG: hypothetical protein A2Z48_04505 [Actinobacteria bacterium RBG_19FT_COMBO_70_19]
MDSRVGRIALTVAGIVCVGLGAAGIVLPVLPTTPFLLLAAACFVRSSPRLHAWLLGPPRLGPYVAGFLGEAEMPPRAKRVAIVTLWLFIALSCAVVLIQAGITSVSVAVVLLLVLVALLVTRYIARRRPKQP